MKNKENERSKLSAFKGLTTHWGKKTAQQMNSFVWTDQTML